LGTSTRETKKRPNWSLSFFAYLHDPVEFLAESDKDTIKEFIKEMAHRLEDVLDDGWQNSSKREEFIKEAKRTLQELILKDYKNKIQISDFHKYLNRLIDIIIKKF